MPLTNKTIKNLKPSHKATASRPDKHTDGNGLQLLVRISGTKSWIASYQWHGKNRNITIGKWPAISLNEARVKNLEIREMLEKGIDPREKALEQKRLQSDAYLFKAYAKKFHDLQQLKVKPGTYTALTSLYSRRIAPVLANKNVTAITPLDILTMARKTAQESGNEQSRRAVRQVSQIMNIAIIEGIIKTNPANDLTTILPPSVTEHRSRINNSRLPRLLSDIGSYNGHESIKIAILMLTHTFTRVTELLTAEWADIDLDNELWTIPAHKMKMNRKHLVPLSPQVTALIRRLKEISGDSQYLFYNKNTRKPYTRAAINNALHNMGYKGQMTAHGFRGLASTTLHEMGHDHDLIELQLAHVTGDKTSRAYNNAQQLLARRQMLNEWSIHIDKQGTKQNGNVITFTGIEDHKQAQGI